MKLKNILYTAFLLLCSIACKKSDTITINDNVTHFTQFPKEVNLSFKDLFEYKKGDPEKLMLLDSIMVIFNQTKGVSHILYRYDLKRKSFFGKGLINKGRGPNEVFSVASFGFNSTSFWLYDVTMKKILSFPKSQLLSSNPAFKEHYLKADFYQLYMLDDHRFLSTGNRETSFKIQEFNTEGKVLNEFGQFGKIPANMPMEVVKDASHAIFFLHPKKHKVAIPYHNQDILEIYDLNPPFKCKAIQGPDMFALNFKPATMLNHYFMEKHANLKYAYDLWGATTANYIYLGYSGLTYAVRKMLKAWGGKSIFIYDWNGKPIKRLNLDRRITAFTVSKDNKMIYAYDAERGFIVKAAL